MKTSQFTFVYISTIVIVLSAILFSLHLPSVEAYAPVPLSSEKVVQFTNKARSEEGIQVLASSTVLASVAQQKAELIARTSDFAHTLKDGTTIWQLLNAAGYRFSSAGENLAIHFLNEEAVVDAWMRSSAHRANILSDDFSEIGVGVAPGEWMGFDGYFVVQLFAKPMPVEYVASSYRSSSF